MVKDPKNFSLGPRGGKPKPGQYTEGLVYHATPTERVDKVLTEGITNRPEGDRQWPAAFRSSDTHVYAWTHPRVAIEHAERQEKRTGKPQSVLAIKAEMEGDRLKHWKPDYTGDRMASLGSIKREDPVAPSDVVDVHHVKVKDK